MIHLANCYAFEWGMKTALDDDFEFHFEDSDLDEYESENLFQDFSDEDDKGDDNNEKKDKKYRNTFRVVDPTTSDSRPNDAEENISFVHRGNEGSLSTFFDFQDEAFISHYCDKRLHDYTTEILKKNPPKSPTSQLRGLSKQYVVDEDVEEIVLEMDSDEEFDFRQPQLADTSNFMQRISTGKVGLDGKKKNKPRAEDLAKELKDKINEKIAKASPNDPRRHRIRQLRRERRHKRSHGENTRKQEGDYKREKLELEPITPEAVRKYDEKYARRKTRMEVRQSKISEQERLNAKFQSLDQQSRVTQKPTFKDYNSKLSVVSDATAFDRDSVILCPATPAAGNKPLGTLASFQQDESTSTALTFVDNGNKSGEERKNKPPGTLGSVLQVPGGNVNRKTNTTSFSSDDRMETISEVTRSQEVDNSTNIAKKMTQSDILHLVSNIVDSHEADTARQDTNDPNSNANVVANIKANAQNNMSTRQKNVLSPLSSPNDDDYKNSANDSAGKFVSDLFSAKKAAKQAKTFLNRGAFRFHADDKFNHEHVKMLNQDNFAKQIYQKALAKTISKRLKEKHKREASPHLDEKCEKLEHNFLEVNFKPGSLIVDFAVNNDADIDPEIAEELRNIDLSELQNASDFQEELRKTMEEMESETDTGRLSESDFHSPETYKLLYQSVHQDANVEVFDGPSSFESGPSIPELDASSSSESNENTKAKILNQRSIQFQFTDSTGMSLARDTSIRQRRSILKNTNFNSDTSDSEFPKLSDTQSTGSHHSGGIISTAIKSVGFLHHHEDHDKVLEQEIKALRMDPSTPWGVHETDEGIVIAKIT